MMRFAGTGGKTNCADGKGRQDEDMTTTAALRETYQRDGFVTGIDIFPDEEIREYRSQFDALEAREGREKCQIGIAGRHFDEEFIWRLASDSRILDAMEAVMGRDILLLSTHFFCKYPDPKGETFVAWHQDITYWGLEPPIANTAWLAIDDSDIENGCMKVIPGTHRTGIAPHGKSESAGNLLSINQEIPDEHVDSSQAVNLELKAGQISIHGGQVFHASQPNTSNRRRCGMVIRFIPPEVRQAEANSLGAAWRPILVRGADRFGNFPETAAPFGE